MTSHNPELWAGAYLAGELTASDRESFESHLLDCEQCWVEVEAGRRGLHAVTQSRELAPAHLRERVRQTLAGAARPIRRPLRRIVLAAAILIVTTGASAGLVVMFDRASEPSGVARAVAGYTADRLPGAQTPKAAAPHLESLGLNMVGAGAGRVGDIDVDAFAYRDANGRRVMIYVGSRAFDMPSDGHPMHGPKGPWMAERDGITVLCARHPHELLIVGKDDRLVLAAGDALDVM